MELRIYKYRLYPSSKQKIKIINSLKICKIIYNELLALSIDSYKFNSITLNKFDFNEYLTNKYFNIHSQIKQNVSDRVHKSFQNFFRRVKDRSCKEKGFPRFKSMVNSITFPQSGFKLLSDKRLKLSKIGIIPIILHRVPKGKIKTLTIKQNKIKQWFAIFSCEIDIPTRKHQSTEKIGIDVGLKNFATLSNGEIIANPRHLSKSEKRLKMLQRRLSKKIKGSANRRKARFKVARLYNKIANQRTDFLHKLSYNLTKSFFFITVEDLNIRGMVHNNLLAKGIHDASWNNFIKNLEYKAVTSGSKLIKINPINTSKTCSKCGNIINISLKERTFHCPKCNLHLQRDLNAAINILKVGTDCAELNACEDFASTTKLVANKIDETRTIYRK